MTGLRRRLLRWLLLPLMALSAGSMVVNYFLALGPANDAYDISLANTAMAMGALLERESGQPVLKLPPGTESVLRFDRVDRVYFAVYSEEGRLIGGDGELPFMGLRQEITFHDVAPAAQPLRLAAVPHRLGREFVVIEVAETRAKREHAARAVMAGVAGPNLLMVLSTLMLASAAVGVGLRPLHRLRALVVRRSPRDLTPLPLADLPEELRPLIEALNRQFALLGEALSSQDRFLSDAAHQLKTPLAALQTQLELAAADRDPEAHARRLAEMADATRRVTHLAHQLLALARAEPSGELKAQRRSLELAEVAEQVARSHLDAAIARGIELRFDLGEARVVGSPWLLRELLANLVDNALAQVPSGGHVTVRCGRRDGRPFIEVEDDGPGIPRAERERAFERFFRLPGARGDGCGLGLAIVREIATSHGATVRIGDGPGGQGAVVAVSFPDAAA